MSNVFSGNFTHKSMQIFLFDYKCSSQTDKTKQNEENQTKPKHKPSVPEVSDEFWI